MTAGMTWRADEKVWIDRRVVVLFLVSGEARGRRSFLVLGRVGRRVTRTEVLHIVPVV